MPQNPLPARLNGPWVPLFTLVLVVGILYTGKNVLLPLALEMLRSAYGRERIAPRAPELTAEEAIRAAIRQQPRLICIAGTASTRGSELRNYCRRIRASLPKTGIVVLRPPLMEDETPHSSERFKEAGADCLALGVKEAVVAIERLLADQQDVPDSASRPHPVQAHA